MQDPIVTDGTGRKWRVVTHHFIDMGRRKHTKMIIKDIKVQDGKCIISLEIRRGSNVWRKAYGFDSKYFKTFSIEKFQERVYADAMKLEEDKKFENSVLLNIEHMKDQTVLLD